MRSSPTRKLELPSAAGSSSAESSMFSVRPRASSSSASARGVRREGKRAVVWRPSDVSSSSGSVSRWSVASASRVASSSREAASGTVSFGRSKASSDGSPALAASSARRSESRRKRSTALLPRSRSASKKAMRCSPRSASIERRSALSVKLPRTGRSSSWGSRYQLRASAMLKSASARSSYRRYIQRWSGFASGSTAAVSPRSRTSAEVAGRAVKSNACSSAVPARSARKNPRCERARVTSLRSSENVST
jgi:hypothetical protein